MIESLFAHPQVPGLYYCGVHFLRKRKSSTLFGVGEDAVIVARSIARGRSELAATTGVKSAGQVL